MNNRFYDIFTKHHGIIKAYFAGWNISQFIFIILHIFVNRAEEPEPEPGGAACFWPLGAEAA